jgi:hypothetical protein
LLAYFTSLLLNGTASSSENKVPNGGTISEHWLENDVEGRGNGLI